MIDAIKQYAGIDFDQVKTDEEAKALADQHKIEYEARHKRGDIINMFFEEYCEDKLIQPTFIMDHPIEISPLTKKKPSDPNKVTRESVSKHRMQQLMLVMRKQTIPMKIS